MLPAFPKVGRYCAAAGEMEGTGTPHLSCAHTHASPPTQPTELLWTTHSTRPSRTHARQSVRASRIPAVPTPPVPLPTRLCLSRSVLGMYATDCRRDVPLRILCVSSASPGFSLALASKWPYLEVRLRYSVLDGESIFPCRPAQPRTDTKLGFFGPAH